MVTERTVRKFSNQYFFGIGFAESSEHLDCVYEMTGGQKKQQKKQNGTHYLNFSDYRIAYRHLTKYD